MKEYLEVLDFNFENKKFRYYIDKSGHRFYLQLDSNNNLHYPTLEDYLKLEELFNNPPLPLIVNDSAEDLTDEEIEEAELSEIIQKRKIEALLKESEKSYNKPHKNKIVRIIPKVLIAGVAITLTPVLIHAFSKNKHNVEDNLETKTVEIKTEDSTEKIEFDLNNFETSIAAQSINRDFKLDTYIDGKSYVYIYGLRYFDDINFGAKPTKEEVLQYINFNPTITSDYKRIFIDYVDALFNKYPDIDCRNFVENLKTLDLKVCTPSEMYVYSGSETSYGCYSSDDNKICILDSFDFNDSWSKQVIFHELTHCLRSGHWEKDGVKYEIREAGIGFNEVIINESLNSLFAVSLFDYEEKDIAYQFQSNIVNILIDCIDYNLEDYINESNSYFVQKLGEKTGDLDYTLTMLALMRFQYDDYHSVSINADQSEYYRLYEYISNIYYEKNIKSNMSYEEATTICDKLLEDMLYDVPEEYNVDTSYFYEYLKSYCKEKGIEVPQKTK